MRHAAILTAAAIGAAMISGPAQPQVAKNDSEKVRQIIVYGTDACPPSRDGEIVVCARRPEDRKSVV